MTQSRKPDVYIDADGCPVKNEVYRATEKYGLNVILACNSFMNVPQQDRIRLVVVPEGPDEADNWIAEHVGENDIVITADIPPADRCIKAGARVLDVRGSEFTPDSIGNQMATRELMTHLRMIGEMSGGPRPFGKKDKSKFISKLHQMIQSVM